MLVSDKDECPWPGEEARLHRRPVQKVGPGEGNLAPPEAVVWLENGATTFCDPVLIPALCKVVGGAEL